MADANVEKMSQGFHGIHDALDYVCEIPGNCDGSSSADLVILGQSYKPQQEKKNTNDKSVESETDANKLCIDTAGLQHINTEGKGGLKLDSNKISTRENTSFNSIKEFFSKISNVNINSSYNEAIKTYLTTTEWPEEFLDDLNTRLWFTYRSGFPLIERDKNGPSPLLLGSLFRGTLDIGNLNKGFTTDSGWGCMIRTSQSLLANALLTLKMGRDWRLSNSTSDQPEEHWKIVEEFADTPEAKFSIHNYVFYAAKFCGKKPGEWFGPSNAAKSIQKLCNENATDTDLKVYLSTDSGDIFEDELMNLAEDKNTGSFNPILILCGVRLGVYSIHSLYWEFLKMTLLMPYGVGIAGGRPSSSHYFFGYQSDYLFYLDPHIPQPAILLDESGHIVKESKRDILDTIHTSKLRKLHLDKIDPSMLIGFLIKNREEYKDFKERITSFDSFKKFLNIHDSRPNLPTRNSTGSELEGFIDLGVESINDDMNEGIIDEDMNIDMNQIEGNKSMKKDPYFENNGQNSGINDIVAPDIEKTSFQVVDFDSEYNEQQEFDKGEITNESMVIISEDDPTDLVVVEDPDVAEHLASPEPADEEEHIIFSDTV